MENISYKGIVYEGRTIKIDDFTPIEVDETIGCLKYLRKREWTSVKIEEWDENFV
jgi:hypothetical protein